MAYDESMYSCCHYYFINYYIHLHFVSGGHGYFLYLRCTIYYYCRWIFLLTPYSFPLVYPLSLCWTWSIIWWFLIKSIFPLRYLVQGGRIYRVCMCYHPIINPRNFTNISPCRDLVNKYAGIFYVLQYAIEILPLSTRYFTRKTVYLCS